MLVFDLNLRVHHKDIRCQRVYAFDATRALGAEVLVDTHTHTHTHTDTHHRFALHTHTQPVHNKYTPTLKDVIAFSNTVGSRISTAMLFKRG